MSSMSVNQMGRMGLYVGAGLVIIPAATTLLIAASRAIFINVIANAILSVLTAGAIEVDIYGLSLIQVPFLWKVSTISAVLGGVVLTVSLTALLINELCKRCNLKLRSN